MRRLSLIFFAAVLAIAPAASAAAPNDPYYVVQWGLKKLQALRAWQVTRGSGTIVAVVDTGVDPHHPDLRGRLLPGRDFADGDNDPSDDNGHGTLVAGIIAAVTGNGIGVSSIAPDAKILPVRVLGRDGSGTSANVAEGIRWAVAQGADVVNLSLAEEEEHGGPGFMVPPSLLADPTVDAAITDAASQGATVLVASGNTPAGGEAKTAYDASQPGVAVVGATAPNDKRAAYSNFGTGLDFVAPGGGSSSDPGDSGCTRNNSVVSLWWNPHTKKSDYGGGCGTSMAVAFASGVAALLHANGLTNVQAVARMSSTAADLAPAGRDDQTGAGRIDAALALGAPPLPRTNKAVKGQAARPASQTPERNNVVTQSSVEPEPLPPGAPAVVAGGPARDAPADPRDHAIELASALLCVLGLAHWLRFAIVMKRTS